MSIDDHQTAFIRGIEEFNHELFFECHDTWEEIWQETSGADKLFLQGLIHAAVGLYHYSNGRWKGANSQLEKCVSKLTGYLPVYRRVDVEALIEYLQTNFILALGEALSGKTIASSPFPKISLKASQMENEQYSDGKLDQQRVLFQNEIASLKRERDEAKEKLKLEKEKFSLTLKRHFKKTARRILILYVIIAILSLSLIGSLAFK